MLKRSLVAVCLLSLSPGLFFIRRAHAAASTFQFHRNDAEASFHMVDGCVVTNVDISAIEFSTNSSSSPPSSGTFVGVGVTQVDTCQNVLLLNLVASQAVPGHPFNESDSLTSASLGTITLDATDSVSGATLPLTVSFDWMGVGDITTTRQSTHVRDPQCHLNGVSDLSRRDADASGLLSFGDTVLSLAGPVLADMGTEKTEGTVISGCSDDLSSDL